VLILRAAKKNKAINSPEPRQRHTKAAAIVSNVVVAEHADGAAESSSKSGNYSANLK
jgi:hypothetical protein